MTTPPLPAMHVMPLRFSAQPARMIALLREIGLRDVVTTEGDTFAELAAPGGGRVLVHAAAGSDTGAVPGETQLCFAVEDTDATASALEARGHQTRVWDETYGRQGALIGPAGESLGLNEVQKDLYGYLRGDAPVAGAEAEPAHGVRVVAIVPSATEERQRDLDFFTSIGFEEVPGGDENWQQVQAAGRGAIGLHAPIPGLERKREVHPPHGDVAQVHLGLETDEDLEALAARLREAGWEAVCERDPLPAVTLNDPDGLALQIHPRPAS